MKMLLYPVKPLPNARTGVYKFFKVWVHPSISEKTFETPYGQVNIRDHCGPVYDSGSIWVCASRPEVLYAALSNHGWEQLILRAIWINRETQHNTVTKEDVVIEEAT
jgi:hypothetical protein